MAKITINDIAKLAGVSKTTVSFYLNGMYEKMSETTRNEIARVIEKTGYQPSIVARSLNAKSNKIVGVVCGDITNSFSNHVIKGIESACKERGYRPLLMSTDYLLDNEKVVLELMVSLNVDGLIVQPTVGFENICKTIGFHKPLVIFDSPIKESEHHWIKTDSYNAVYELVKRMNDKGYQRMVYITADPFILYTRKERYDGFLAAIDKLNIDSRVVIVDNEIDSEDIYNQLKIVLNDEVSTCMIVASNWLLPKLFPIISSFIDKIPDKLGLAAFDAEAISKLARPSLTTIVQPAFEEGLQAANMLIDLIENKELKQDNLILSCYIEEKQSTNKSEERN